MDEIVTGVNWLAVGVGTVLAYLLGWLWYSQWGFGAAWAKGAGIDLATVTGVPMKPMAAQLLGTFLLAWVVGVTERNQALLTCILVIVMVAVLTAANGYFAKKSDAAVGIEAGFVITMGAAMIAVQGLL